MDVGARQQIFALVKQIAQRGVGVIVASSDHEQLATICDRVLIFSYGRIVQEIVGDAISKHRITEQSYGSSSLAPRTRK